MVKTKEKLHLSIKTSEEGSFILGKIACDTQSTRGYVGAQWGTEQNPVRPSNRLMTVH
jgi:hypothetical protein